MNIKKKVLVLGASGMLGHTLMSYFLSRNSYIVAGTSRSSLDITLLGLFNEKYIYSNVNAEFSSQIENVFVKFKPDIVINCIGRIKQLPLSENIEKTIYINSLLPHLISNLCIKYSSKFIHFSTDCVFSGLKGMYQENDSLDGSDIYARTKILGEVNNPHSITLRSSLIGHELRSKKSLLEWFLSQHGEVYGYKNAIFSGLPAVEMARVVHDFVIPNTKLSGIFHISSKPISKFELLNLIAQIYEKKIEIKAEEVKQINLSLDSTRFRDLTGYTSPEWSELINFMRIYG